VKRSSMRRRKGRVTSLRRWLVTATVVLALAGGTTTFTRQAEPAPQVACAPDAPVIESESGVIVRAWVTDDAGRPIPGDGLRFEWSTDTGRIEGRDFAAWKPEGGRQSAEATVAVTWRTQRTLCTVRVEVLPPAVFPGRGTGRGGDPGIPSGPDRGGRLSGRSFLRENTPELEGYGLYSYLLFATPPKTNEDRDRALQTLEALVLVLQPVEAVERYRTRKELNLTQVPVTGPIDVSVSVTTPIVAAATAQQILDRYDYARAQDLLLRLGINDAEGGPYLVSSAVPATKSATASGTQIVFDMRRAVPKLTWDWVTGFTRLAAQERSWTAEAMAKLALNTRNVLAVAARETPEVLVALTDWVRVVHR
jgi:hypothetical protein